VALSNVRYRERLAKKRKDRKCKYCGCTDEDCSQCIERTGLACYWISEDKCSACNQVNEEDIIISCPECLELVTQDELNTFGGLCEECTHSI